MPFVFEECKVTKNYFQRVHPHNILKPYRVIVGSMKHTERQNWEVDCFGTRVLFFAGKNYLWTVLLFIFNGACANRLLCVRDEVSSSSHRQTDPKNCVYCFNFICIWLNPHN